MGRLSDFQVGGEGYCSKCGLYYNIANIHICPFHDEGPIANTQWTVRVNCKLCNVPLVTVAERERQYGEIVITKVHRSHCPECGMIVDDNWLTEQLNKSK